MENRTDHIIKCRNPVRSLKVFFKTPKKWLYNELYSPHKKIIYHRRNIWNF